MLTTAKTDPTRLLASDELAAHSAYIDTQRAAQAALRLGDRVAYARLERECAWRHLAWTGAWSRLRRWTETPQERGN